MLPIGLNHMTCPHGSAHALIDLAAQLGCVGVELRNDLHQPLFDGQSPDGFRATIRKAGVRLLALAEVKAFNAVPENNHAAATDLIRTAAACGAEGVALIPWVDTGAIPRDAQRAALVAALDMLQPVLEEHHMRGYIEPLGFVTSSLRYKEDVVAVLDARGRPSCFAMVHDTFHHHLAGGGAVYADLTAIVHISGVTDPAVEVDDMTDAHRVLVDAHDRLDTIGQLQSLINAGYTGPASFEAFAPKIHDMKDPAEALAGSIAFITSRLTEPKVSAA